MVYFAVVANHTRWGIIGCGSVATSAVAPAIHWADRNELLAVASRTQARADQKAAEVRAPRAYGCYEAVLADSDIDAIYLAVPNGEHARWAIAAANAGKHVLCEKSLTLRVTDARAMVSAFRAADRILVEGFMVRHHPQWTLLRSLLSSGTIGAVRHVRAWLRGTVESADDHRFSQPLGGGALFDVTCYAVNAARFAIGEEPTRTKATARWASAGLGAVDESTDALLEFPSGAVASVHGSLRAPFEQGLVVAGEHGRVVLSRPFVPGWDPVEVVVETRAGVEVRAVGGANHTLHMLEHIGACMRDRALPLFPAEDGLANVEACAAILEACARPT